MDATLNTALKNACRQLRYSFTKAQVQEIAKAHDVQQFPMWFRRAFGYKLELPHFSIFELSRFVIDYWDKVPISETAHLSKYDLTGRVESPLEQTRDAWYWLKRQPRFAICNAVASIFLNEHQPVEKYCAALLVCMSGHEACIKAEHTGGYFPGEVLARRLAENPKSHWIIAYPRIVQCFLWRELVFWDGDAVSHDTQKG